MWHPNKQRHGKELNGHSRTPKRRKVTWTGCSNMQKCKTRNSNPLPNQQKSCYLILPLPKTIINIAKTQKEAATKGALGIRTWRKIIKQKAFCSFLVLFITYPNQTVSQQDHVTHGFIYIIRHQKVINKTRSIWPGNRLKFGIGQGRK